MPALAPGCSVTLHGLVGRFELNGRSGIVRSPLEDGRYTVDVQTADNSTVDKTLRIKPTNLERRSTDDYVTQKERLNAADDVANVGKALAEAGREFAAAKTSGYIVNRDDHNNTIIQSTDFDDKHDDHKHDCDFKSTLPDTKEWMEVLLEQQAHGTQFTDVEQFPPKESSLVVHLAEDDVKGTYRRTIYTCTRTSTRALSC